MACNPQDTHQVAPLVALQSSCARAPERQCSLTTCGIIAARLPTTTQAISCHCAPKCLLWRQTHLCSACHSPCSVLHRSYSSCCCFSLFAARVTAASTSSCSRSLWCDSASTWLCSCCLSAFSCCSLAAAAARCSSNLKRRSDSSSCALLICF